MLPIYWFAASMAVLGLFLTLNAMRSWDQRPDITEHLRPFHQSVGDEAQAWLNRRGHGTDEN